MHAPVTKVIDHTKLAWLHHEGLADIHAYLDILRLQHGGNVPSKSGHGGANEHLLPSIVYSHIQVETSQVLILPDVRTGTTASSTSIPIIYEWVNLQKTLFVTRPCKYATVTLMLLACATSYQHRNTAICSWTRPSRLTQRLTWVPLVDSKLDLTHIPSGATHFLCYLVQALHQLWCHRPQSRAD